MPLPDDIATFTLTGEFPPLAPDGTERTGSFTFTPVPPVLASADGIYLGVENATLDASGGFSKELVANDALDEPFVWRVDQNITGTPPRSYNISVPASAGTVSLGSYAEFEALPDDYAVVIGPRGPEGPAGSGGAAGALLAANNLSDLGSATTARTNLGLGTAATQPSAAFDPAGSAAAAQGAAIAAIPPAASTVTAETSYGQTPATGAGTAYARSDHTHGTPALPRLDQVATPTGDVAMGGHKLTGLADGAAPGDAATVGQVPVAGTTAGTYAAGNDARLSDARTPTGTAGGDLSGSFPGPTVAKVNGVSVTGTPTAGQVPTATSSSAASWQTPTAPPSASGTVAAETAFGQSSAAGSSAAYSRGDHTHGTPTLPAASTSAAGVVQMDGTAGDVQPLGVQAAGAVGKAADAGHVHAMPRLDQVSAPAGAVSLNGQKVTNLANGTASSDAAAFGQIPTAGTGASNFAAGNDSRITGAAQKASNLSDLASASSARANLGMVDMVPADAGLLTWVYPPWATSSTGAGNGGFIYYMRVRIPVATTVTNAELYQTAAGSGLTAGLVGLYTQAGSRVAVTADQASAWATGAQVEKVIPFTAPYSAAAGYYWVAMLFTGTTGPSWAKGPPSGALNAGWHSAPYPALISASGQTSLPSSVDLTSLSLAVSAFWAALS